jgi:hypothetical protein
MPADRLYPGEVDPEPRPEGQFRADLVRYLDSLPTWELGSLLSKLPRTRPGVLMIELNERLPDSGKLLPFAGTPGPGEGRRRSLRESAADRRAPCNQPTAGPSDIVDRHRWRGHCATAGGGPGLFDDVAVQRARRQQCASRKTDMSDAEWLADVVAHGMVRLGFAPPPPIRRCGS